MRKKLPKGVIQSKKLVSVQQAADMHGVSTEAVRHWIRRGYVTAMAVGKIFVLRRADVETVRERVQPPGIGPRARKTRRAR